MMTSDKPAPNFEQWEVCQAKWQHEDGTEKDRPVLVLSSTKTCRNQQQIWVAKFTKTNRDVPFKIQFCKTDASFAATGLTADCFLYIHECRQIDKSLLLYHRGQLGLLSAALIAWQVKQALKFPIP